MEYDSVGEPSSPQKPGQDAAFPIYGRGEKGLTMRDYFAAGACAAIVGALMNKETWHGWSNPDIAKEAFDIADAMLAERAK